MVDKYIKNMQMPDGTILKFPALPSGGLVNNVLTKKGESDYDVQWAEFVSTTEQIHSDITTGDIVLSDITNSIFRITPTKDIEFTITSDILQKDKTYTFELKITMNTLCSFTFPDNIKWVNDETPDLSEIGIYYLVFRTDDGGTTWFGNSQGRWS